MPRIFIAWCAGWLVVCSAALGGLAGATPACAADDLLAVYAQARAADPQLAAAFARHGVQQELAVQARAPLLPQWSLELGEARRHPGGPRESAATSRLTQALFDLGSLRQWQAARTEVSAQAAQLQAAEQDLRARVARAYLGVLLARASTGRAEAIAAAYQQQVDQAQTRFETGLSAAVDVEQARTYAALAQGQAVRARQGLADAQEALAQITGRPGGALKALAATLPVHAPPDDDTAAWLERALAGNPLLQAETWRLAADEQRIGAARAAHTPTLSLGWDNTRHGGSLAVGEPRSSGQVMLRLNVPLFAGGATASRVRQTALERDLQRETLEAARRAVLRDTQAQLQAVRAGRALVDSGALAVAAADRALASTRAGIALGTRSMTDLLLAIQTQAQALEALEQARHGWVLATVLLLQAAGALGDAELATVNALLEDTP